MRSPVVDFSADERALLDLLNAKAEPDNCVRALDSELIAELGLSEREVGARFFAPKLRLVAAGAISLFVQSFDGWPIVRVNAPERGTQPVSKRYVFAAIPVETIAEVRKLVRRRRNEAIAKQQKERAERKAAQATEVDSVAANEPGPLPETGATAEPAPKVAIHKKREVTADELKCRTIAQKRGMRRLGVQFAQPGSPIRPPLAEGAKAC